MEKEQQMERLEKHLHDLKERDPLQGIPQSNRCAIATLRLVDSLLWLAYHMPTSRSTMSEEEMQKLHEDCFTRYTLPLPGAVPGFRNQCYDTASSGKVSL